MADPERPWERWLEAEPPHPADAFGASRRAPDHEPAGALGPRLLSVDEVTRLVRDSVRAEPALRDLWVEGEVGQVSVSAAGHCYFTLKDARAQLRCVLFRDERRFLPFEPQTGLRVVAHGRVDVFEQQGAYQLYVDTLQPAGFGDLALRLEALKAALAAEGLFDAARKRPIPGRPERVGIATSLGGAVLHDIVQVLRRRWPLAHVLVAPCQVQGDGAPASIVAALRRLARWRDERGRPLDVVILARGGGSLEDLWPFNEEGVVRAVAGSPIPTVVGVGHETDVTLAEFAADIRAATPSVAAELVVPARTDELAALGSLRGRANVTVMRALRGAEEAVGAERRALDRLRPAALLTAERERVGLLLDRAARAVSGRLATERDRLERSRDRLPALGTDRLARARLALGSLEASLEALGPYATLERGYAIVRDSTGQILREAASRSPGDPLEVRLARGGLDVRVERVRDPASGESA
ncbi:MAG TPA: exodeoxyribonuclease VII large subunit [Candidatus Limnocylindrales bacterium]|jgi:exodeoxyribonuclease VII large subunit|nr:exodeoxyribonuclease VII large subunit [Candidatus Limnocylindrales bacterium]